MYPPFLFFSRELMSPFVEACIPGWLSSQASQHTSSGNRDAIRTIPHKQDSKLARTTYLRIFLGIHTSFHRDHGKVEFCHGKAEAIQDARLPMIREALFFQHRLEIINTTTENRQHCSRAISVSPYSSK